MAPLRVGFWGNFGTTNWGNECTLQAMLHNVRQRLPNARLSCFCSNPDDTRVRHGVEAFPMRAPKRLSLEWLATLRFASRLDCLVMTGTGMITDVEEGPLGMPYDLFRWAVAARAWGVKLAFASVGVEPIRHPAAKRLIGMALGLADTRSFRDRQSQDLLKGAGFSCERDSVCPDLAFSLPESMTARPAKEPGRRRKAAVGVYNYLGCGAAGGADAASYANYIEKLGWFVVWLFEHDYDVRILIGDLTYDAPVVRDLRAWLEAGPISGHSHQFEDQPATSVDQVIDQIADADVVVASRFHNVLFGLLVGRPVLSIAYNAKNDALMGSVGLADYCRSVDTFEVDDLIERFCALEAGARSLLPFVAARVAVYRRELEQQYDVLFGEVDARPLRDAPKAVEVAGALPSVRDDGPSPELAGASFGFGRSQRQSSSAALRSAAARDLAHHVD